MALGADGAAGTLTLAVWKPPGRGRWGDGFESGSDAGGGASGARCSRSLASVSPSSTGDREALLEERTRPRQMRRRRAAGTAEQRSSMTLRSGRICARRGKEMEGR